MKSNDQLSKFQKIPELYPPLIKIFEQRGVIVLLAFVAVLALSWAIQANGRYTAIGPYASHILDTRTGKVSDTYDAPQIWSQSQRERVRAEKHREQLPDVDEANAEWLDKLPIIDELNAELSAEPKSIEEANAQLERQRRNQR